VDSLHWVVLVEADAAPGDVVDLARVEALLALLSDFEPVGIYSVDRYAVQVSIPLDDPATAVASALRIVGEAAARVGLPDHVVRAQAMTPEELEAEIAASEGDVPALPFGPVDDVLAAALEATRVLVRATTARQVTDVVVRLINRLGGRVTSADDNHPGAFRLGLELVPGQPLAAVAEGDDTWLRLAEALPPVLDDAWLVLPPHAVGAAVPSR
jgi:hypothetical protein